MATYEVTVSRSGSTVITSWSPSPTGNGTLSSRYQFAANDIIKFKKNSSSDGSVSVSPSSGFFTTDGAISCSTVFTSRTVNSTSSTDTLSYSIFYDDGGGFGGP